MQWHSSVSTGKRIHRMSILIKIKNPAKVIHPHTGASRCIYVIYEILQNKKASKNELNFIAIALRKTHCE